MALLPLFIPAEHNAGAPHRETSFSLLSEDAQQLIVGAVLGEFDDAPPVMEPHVREEISAWLRGARKGDRA